jgi:hypothetical protein
LKTHVTPTLLLVAFAALPLLADGQIERAYRYSPKAVVDPATDVVIPVVGAGGLWATKITVVNLQATTSKVEILFADNNGNDLQLPIQGLGNTNALLVTVPGNGSYTVQTIQDANAPMIEGFAILSQNGSGGSPTYGKVATITSLRYGNSEAIIPLSTMLEHKALVTVDNRDGFKTLGAVVNFGTRPAILGIRVFAEDGTVITSGSVSIPAAGRVVFDSSKVDSLQSARATVEFTTSNQFMSAFGIKVNPDSVSLAAYPSISLKEWQQ